MILTHVVILNFAVLPVDTSLIRTHSHPIVGVMMRHPDPIAAASSARQMVLSGSTFVLDLKALQLAVLELCHRAR